MADSFIQLPPNSTGLKLDTEELVVGANTVERERVQITGATALQIAGVTAAEGLDVDVTRLPALVAGTANIGDVDVLTVPAPLSTTGGGTEATALRVTVANDSTGVLSIDDNGGSLTVDLNGGTDALIGRVKLTDGTDIALVTAAGEQNVLATPQPGVDIGDVTVNNASGGSAVNVQDGGNSLTIDDANLDNASLVDNAGFTDGTTRVLMDGYIFDETAGVALTENDAAAAHIDSKRAQVLVIEDETTRGRRTTVTAANALKVDGSAVTQPVSLAANQSVNVAQINGVTPLMGNGSTGTGSHRVTIASDNSAVSGLGAAATGAAPPANAVLQGGLASGATGGFLTAHAVCDTFVNVNVNTATTTLLITGVSGRHVRICSMSLVTAAANNVALLSGTGATCGTGTTGMSGGTTAATGWNFAANSGLSQGSGIGAINQTNATGDSVCVATSAATQLSGRISYTIY